MGKLFLGILLLSFVSGIAQTEADIRTHYKEVNQQIASSLEQGFEGALYNNRWETNKNGKSWPATGIYSEITDCWYDDPPDHLPASERNPKNVLLKVNISRKSSALLTHEEYLYREGKLLFYYAHEGEEGNEWETRVYFNTKGLAFKTSVKANGKELAARDLLTAAYRDFKPNPVFIMTEAKKLQDLFVKSM